MTRWAQATGCALLLVGALTDSAAALTPICTPIISSNTTWGPTGSPPDSVYLVTCSITVRQSATLTIQAGTTLRFASGVYLSIGSPSPGSLEAVGTTEDPIFFIGDQPQPGYWAGIKFGSGSDDPGELSVLEHCEIRHGGSASPFGALVQCTDTTMPTMVACRFSESATVGLWLHESPVSFSECVFSDNASYPLTATPRTLGQVANGNTFVPDPSGRFNAIQIMPGPVATDATWPAPPFPFTYFIPYNYVRVEGAANPVLTIEPGTVIKFASVAGLPIGANEPGALAADGVTFTSATDDTLGDVLGDGPSSPAAGDWNAITFSDQTIDAKSRLSNCLIRYGGGGPSIYGALSITDASPVISGCVFSKNKIASLGVFTGCPLTVTNCVFRDSDQAPMNIDPGVVACALDPAAGNTIVPNADGRFNVIKIHAGTVTSSTTWPVPPPEFTYLIENGEDIRVQGPGGPLLTLLPGTVIKHRGTTFWEIGATAPAALVATGVTFTSAFDDTLGDALGDGAISPAAGNWESVVFKGQTIDAASRLENCLIRYGGNNESFFGALSLNDAGPTITGCVFERNRVSSLGTITGCTGTVTDCVFRDSDQAPMNLDPGAVECALAPGLGNVIVPNLDGRFNVIKIHSGTVTSSTTWPLLPPEFTYLVENGHDIQVQAPSGPVLTLLAGTVIKQRGTTFWEIGSTAPGGLVATGVTFTSAFDDTLGDALGDGSVAPNPGDWESVVFRGQTNDGASRMEDCLIRYGGNNQSLFGALSLSDASPLVTGCIFERNRFASLGSTGICSVPVTSCTFRDQGGAVVDIDPMGPACILAPGLGNTFVPNPDGRFNVFKIRTGSGVVASTTWPLAPAGFTYLLDNGNDVLVGGAASPVLTITSGTVIKHRPGSIWRIGVGGSGALQASGVTFTSAYDDTLGDALGDGATAPAPGDWESLVFDAQTLDAQSSLLDCLFRYGGGNTSVGFRGTVSLIDAAPTITRCTFERNRYSSFGVESGSCPIPITGCSIRGFDVAAMDLDPRVVGCVLSSTSGNTIVPNPDGRYNVIKINTNPFPLGAVAVTQSTTWPKPPPGFTYLLENNHYIMVRGPAGPVLTISPGTIIKHRGVSHWRIGEAPTGGLRANDVTFTSAYDDTGGDALGDGAVPPAAGDWQFLLFGASTIDSSSELVNCRLRYGGKPSEFGGMLALRDASPVIDRCQLASSQTAALYTSGIGSSQEITCSSITGSARGLENLDAHPQITLCDLVGNTGPAILNHDSTTAIDAEMNWWGCPDGPGGAGCDSVVGLVDFDPWSPVPLSCAVTSVPAPPGDAPPGPPRSAEGLVLLPASPNPFRGRTSIAFDVPEPGGPVALRVYDASGRLVRTLRQGVEPPGRREVAWTGLDDDGRRVASGVYFLVLTSRGVSRTDRLTLAR